MKILFNNTKLYKQNQYLSTQKSNNIMFKKTNETDSFISFSSKKRKKDPSISNNIKLIMAAALISASSHAKDNKQIPYSNSPAITTVDLKWWNKYNRTEHKVIEKIENEVANIYEKTGIRPTAKDASSLVRELEIDTTHTKLVKSLLEEYENTHYKDFYDAGSKHISPNKQKLKQKALVEIFNYTFETGKILKYNDENINEIMEKIKANEEEKPYLKSFLKPYLNINKVDVGSFYDEEITGNFNED